MRLFNLTLGLATFVLAVSTVSATDWNAQYSPTRKEWLELSLSKQIIEVTNLWEKRIGVNVVVFQKEETIAIVLDTSNGQADFSPTVCANYAGMVRKIADDHIKQYGWAKGVKVEVRCT